VADTSLVFNIVARDKASKTFDKIKGKAAILGAAAGIMAIKFGKDSVAAFVEAEQAQNRLSDAFDKFPKLADTNIGRLQSLNSALALKTKYDDDATASGQAVLAQFDLTGKQLETITPLMQDFAAKTGRDLPTAAGLMGKAYLGNTKALKALGINYKSTGDKTKDFANINELMRQKVGGFAQKEGKTAAGQAEILRNQFGELQETVGSKLVPVLTKLGTGLLKVIGFVERNKAVIGPLAAILGTLGGTLFVIVKVTKAYTAAQAALNVVMAMNPIGLVIVAIALLAAGLVIAWKKSETFRNVVKGVFFAVSGFIVSMVIKWLGALGSIFTVLGKLPGKLGAPFRAAAGAIDTARGKVLAMQAELNRLKSKSVTVRVYGAGQARTAVMRLNAALRATGGGHVSIGGVGSGRSEGLAEGGIVRHSPGGTLVTIGEGGHDEAVIPLSGPNAPRGGGGTTVINLRGPTDQILVQWILSAQRNNGGSLPMLKTSPV
jgi:hypothetical protein